MQAIEVKYLGPTDTKGARYKATSASGKSATVPYDHALSPEHNAARAVAELCKKLNWSGDYALGSLARSYVAVAMGDTDELEREVLRWAATPGEHGGNPYLHKFVKLAVAHDPQAYRPEVSGKRVRVLDMSWPAGHPSRVMVVGFLPPALT